MTNVIKINELPPLQIDELSPLVHAPYPQQGTHLTVHCDVTIHILYTSEGIYTLDDKN